MTGFGRAAVEIEGGLLGCELRSVNHRFCDVKVRLSRDLASFEPRILSLVRGELSRGAIEVNLRWRRRPAKALALHINLPLVEAYRNAHRALCEQLGVEPEIDPQHALTFEGVLEREESTPDEQVIGGAIDGLVHAAIQKLKQVRAREGASMVDDLKARGLQLRSHLSSLTTLTAEGARARQQRLQTRLQALLGDQGLDPARLALEVALLADKADVSEEITRLAAHLEAFEQILCSTGAQGRRFDFLVQELNREANTIGSKSSEVEVTAVVMELKAEIERIREQVQNVE